MTTAEKRLREFDEEFALTRKFLDLVPDDCWMWKPHPKSMELGRLTWHLADIPDWCQATLSQDVLRMTPQDMEESMHGWLKKTRAEILARFDAMLPKARTAIARLTEEDWARSWKMEWAGQIVIDEPREDVYRKYTIHHMVHHRAQMGVYLRILGIPIPGCYGPSADEEVMEPAAQVA